MEEVIRNTENKQFEKTGTIYTIEDIKSLDNSKCVYVSDKEKASMLLNKYKIIGIYEEDNIFSVKKIKEALQREEERVKEALQKEEERKIRNAADVKEIAEHKNKNINRMKISVIKKNRMYYKCKNEKGYEIKLLINDDVLELENGDHELLVEDISVRSKYGIDVIYKMISKTSSKIVTLTNKRANNLLSEKCRNLGGKYDSDQKTWIFDSFVEEEVEELDYFFNSNIKVIEITAKKKIFGERGCVKFAGYPICKSCYNESAHVAEEVSMISGNIYSNYHKYVAIVEKDSVFRLRASENLIKEFLEDEDFEVKFIEIE